ncbi:hypothetical protein FisN_15Hh023 [Fistulifera solaris]|uniref:Uncharacterized protein n=1 Tax=Fistulifera solaris TaxID=1519565 RepID=A0A1Z5KA59_FISSO|nr:hypothetical protein FisN_15Hh023 [Fistulifera solaris]|eukprot:GAX23076.1 hypothetical protein FisN_15Hh023 [Fistulifera solaris]
MEEAFACIERGNQALDTTNYWQASHCYCRAFQHLHSLSVSSSVTPDIADLCQSQSLEYKQKARECFVQALQQQQEEQAEHIPSNDDKVNRERLELFAHLYADTKLLDQNTPASNTTTLDDLSLRLQALHAFEIPNQSKSKIEELNAGLRRLGLQPVTSLEDTRKQYASNEWLHVEPNRTPDEQLDVLLRQVQEQVHIVGTTDQAGNVAFDNKGDDDTMDEESQVNQLLQQANDGQALRGDVTGCNDDVTSSLAINVDSDESYDEDLTRQSLTSLPLSAQTAEKVMKDTLEAELLLTQVLALLEKDEEDELERSNSTNDDSHADATVVQKLLRQTRSLLRRAEQNAKRNDDKNN